MEVGWDVCWDRKFFILDLKTVYVEGGTGCFPGQDAFHPRFKNCLYGRQGEMFPRTGCLSSQVYMRIFLPGTISPGTICKVSIISSRQSGAECLCDKNCPALPVRNEECPGKILSI